MASTLDIVNRALRRIGEQRLTSLAETDPKAQAVRDLYNEVRVSLLPIRAWPFATAVARLARIAEATPTGFTYAYAKPSTAPPSHPWLGPWLRTLDVWADDSRRSRAKCSDEGSWLLSDEEELYMRYIGDVEDPNRMSGPFREVLAAKLASELAVALANSNELSDRMEVWFRRALATAAAIDSQSDTPAEEPVGEWEATRWVGAPTF